MLNLLHTTADLAADHRRTLLAEAETYRLARTAGRSAPGGGNRRIRSLRWLRLPRVRGRGVQPAGRACA